MKTNWQSEITGIQPWITSPKNKSVSFPFINTHFYFINNILLITNNIFDDYLRLYAQTIKTLASNIDPSRPFVLSSPSNGVETERFILLNNFHPFLDLYKFRQGGVASNPNNPAFGDIHFYSEVLNLWKPESYLIPRCASEFGVQSIPMRCWFNLFYWFLCTNFALFTT